jgi:predicted ATP-grasp superfamily ATP-dependent carboligase/2-polyprenyl-3-methyl-5-hydroxy-6-metoxy-1,4-benzoquinol methylase
MCNDTPVLVLRLDHHGALGAIRSLGRLGVAVYGVHHSADTLPFRSRYLRGHFLLDLDAEATARPVARLLEIARGLGGRPILLPTNDETALFVAAHAAPLRAAFRFQDNSRELVEGLYDKRSMGLLADELGIPTARTWAPRNLDEVRAFAEGARFPLMLKGSDVIRLSQRTGEKMWIVRSVDELVEVYQRAEDLQRPDLMLQEYIPGGEDAQWMFNGYFDARSRCLFGVTGRKLRQTPPYTGMTSLGECVPGHEIERLVYRLVEGTGYRGILDIGFRFDARDGCYKLLDVNPRLGATFRLFVGEDGLDVVRAQYLDLTGQPVPSSTAQAGRKWFVEELDLVSSVRYHGDGALGVRDWLRSFAGVQESAWFARDDWRPFAGMCGRFVHQAARGAGRRLGLEATPRPHALPAAHQAEVTRHFARSADAWQRTYQRDELPHIIIRARHALALRWLESVPLEPGAAVLEVGCGAGHASIALAQRGFRVHALDAAPEMLRLAAQSARAAGVEHLTTSLGDVHSLDLADGRFDLVLALGVLPWLHAEARGVAEMARVLRPGGWLILSADNSAPLHRLLDPRATPMLRPLRATLKRWLRVAHPDDGCPALKTHDARHLARLLRDAGLERVRSSTVGFGPFSLLGRRLLSERAGVALQSRLQELADRDWPVLRSTGAHHLILARKPV